MRPTVASKVCELGGRHRQSGIQPLRSGPRHSRIRPAHGGMASCACNVVGANQRHRFLLRTRRERPRCRSAAEQYDELAPLHVSHGDFLPYALPPPRPTGPLGFPAPQPATEMPASPWDTLSMNIFLLFSSIA